MLPIRGLKRRMLEMLSLRQRRTGLAFDPNDRATLEDLAERSLESFQKQEDKERLGTIGRGRHLLRIIGETYPTQKLAAEYFRNLEHLLKARKRRESPGQVLLGLGTGRSGSTSLAALLAAVDDCLSTHENPPSIFWAPAREQVQFHMRRFRSLAEYFSLVVDVSHWWLNALDSFFKEFPDGKIIGLIRDGDTCTRSFMRIMGFGWGSWNHWVPYDNGIWISQLWDPTFPTYPVPKRSWIVPDDAKYKLIRRYVREYNQQLEVLAASRAGHVILVGTDELSAAAIQRKVFDFAGVNGSVSDIILNVRSVIDAQNVNFKY